MFVSIDQFVKILNLRARSGYALPFSDRSAGGERGCSIDATDLRKLRSGGRALSKKFRREIRGNCAWSDRAVLHLFDA